METFIYAKILSGCAEQNGFLWHVRTQKVLHKLQWMRQSLVFPLCRFLSQALESTLPKWFDFFFSQSTLLVPKILCAITKCSLQRFPHVIGQGSCTYELHKHSQDFANSNQSSMERNSKHRVPLRARSSWLVAAGRARISF